MTLDDGVSGGAGSANILLFAAEPASESEPCAAFRSAVETGGQAVVVTGEQSAEEWLATNAPRGQLPAELVVVSLDETARSSVAVAGAPTSPMQPPGGPQIETMPADTLAALGRLLTTTLRTFATDTTHHAQHPVLCFDAITTLLDENDVATVFRFLHLLTSLTTHTDTIAHYHLDPTTHDHTTVNTLSPLFDATHTH